MKSDVTGLLGLCRRAGKLTVGFDATVSAVKKQTAKLVLLSSDVSPKTAKELQFFAEESGCPVLILSLTKETCGKALGLQKAVGAVGITDAGFAKSVLKKGTDE